MSEVKVTQALIETVAEIIKETAADFEGPARLLYVEIAEAVIPAISQSATTEARSHCDQCLAAMEQARGRIEALIPMPGNDRQVNGTYAQGVFDALTTLTEQIERMRNGQG